MYTKFYGLEQMPFSISPDTSLYVNLPSHNHCMELMKFAIESGEGFLKITGDVGTGKTILCRKILHYLKRCKSEVSAEIEPVSIQKSEVKQKNKVAVNAGGQYSSGTIQVKSSIKDWVNEYINIPNQEKTLKQQEEQNKYVCVYIPNPTLSKRGLFRLLAKELKVDISDHITVEVLIERVHAKILNLNLTHSSVVILIDEAQSLPEETLEALRLITNFETETHKLVQVILMGQSELDELLNQHRFRQLRQRITFSFHLDSLTVAQTKQYIMHRLGRCGYNSTGIFTEKQFHLIHKYSKGIPRMINVLCHKCLLYAFSQNRKKLQNTDIKLAIYDDELFEQPSYQSAFYYSIFGLMTLSIFTLALWYNFIV
ncbi:ExeA family protein [Marinicellulosiphila megalodicopiae]|uniref:ExeA family protein n=1 Tax=Marinicellulosiphila megalodicopiae TaxID=2724896 RepID=UPI003BB0DB57